MAHEPPPDSLGIPADWMNATTTMPSHCVRHGMPAVRRVDLALQSRPQMTNNRLTRGNVLGLGSRFGEWGQRITVTRVRGWPLCGRCITQRRAWVWPATALFWGGLALVVGAVAVSLVNGPAAMLTAPLLGGFAAMLASVVPFARASYLRITQAQTSADGTQVIISHPHRHFATELRALADKIGDQFRVIE